MSSAPQGQHVGALYWELPEGVSGKASQGNAQLLLGSKVHVWLLTDQCLSGKDALQIFCWCV